MSTLTLGHFLSLGAILFALRPGARRMHRDAAESIFRNETSPAKADEKEVE